MATLKLKSRAAPPGTKPARPDAARTPIRGAGSAPRPRPTLAQAQTQRAERDARAAAEPPTQPRPTERRWPADDRRRDESGPRPNVGRHARPLTPPRPQAPPATPQPGDAGRWSREAPHADRGRAEPVPRRVDQSLPPARPEATPSASGEGIRLSKRMSALGIASRREADEWIPKGWVQVDGRVVDQLGARVRPDQRITVDARARFVQAQKVTVLLHKPLGYVSGQAEDGHMPAVTLVQRDRQWHDDASGTRFLPTHLRGLAPAGRLDLDSTGLLVLTQDGRIARQLIGEDSAVEKEYLVHVEPSHGRTVDWAAALPRLRHGLVLDDVALRPADVDRQADGTLRIVLREGRKRQIRRMCEAVGLQVVALQRVRIGGVRLGDLPPGQWRYLRGDEAFAPLTAPAKPAAATPSDIDDAAP